MAPLRPLGDRVLIAPDPPETTTASGLELVEWWRPEQSGRVVALGRQCTLERVQQLVTQLESRDDYVCAQAAHLLSHAARPMPASVGQRVLFSASAGQETEIDGERYFLMRETDLLAVVEDDGD